MVAQLGNRLTINGLGTMHNTYISRCPKNFTEETILAKSKNFYRVCSQLQSALPNHNANSPVQVLWMGEFYTGIIMIYRWGVSHDPHKSGIYLELELTPSDNFNYADDDARYILAIQKFSGLF